MLWLFRFYFYSSLNCSSVRANTEKSLNSVIPWLVSTEARQLRGCVLGSGLMGVICLLKTTPNSTSVYQSPLSCLQPPPLTHLLASGLPWEESREQKKKNSFENEYHEDVSVGSPLSLHPSNRKEDWWICKGGKKKDWPKDLLVLQ